MKMRETPGFVAEKSARGVRITAKESSRARSRVVSQRVWEQLSVMSDSSFDGSCVLELGIGTFKR